MLTKVSSAECSLARSEQNACLLTSRIKAKKYERSKVDGIILGWLDFISLIPHSGSLQKCNQRFNFLAGSPKIRLFCTRSSQLVCLLPAPLGKNCVLPTFQG